MTCRELVEQCKTQNEDLLERGAKAATSLDDEQWNKAPKGGWSPAQIFEHLILSNNYYVAALERLLPSAPKGGDKPVRFTWFGNFIQKAAGPAGNAPAPKPFHPRPGPYTREVFDRWNAQQERIILLHEQAKDVDLGSVKVKNAILKLFRMTLCDVFAIFAVHTERHIGQIESRVKK